MNTSLQLKLAYNSYPQHKGLNKKQYIKQKEVYAKR